jgi:glutaredoxin 3
MAMTSIELYELEGCPFCAKVTQKLDELGLEYESHMVSRSHDERDTVKEVSGQTGVPVLVDPDNGVEGMPESSDIIAHLEEAYGDSTRAEANA